MSAILARFLDLRARAEQQTPRHIDPARPVWIFGAGHFGRSLRSVFRQQGIAVAGFVETMPRSASADDLPVIDWAALAQQEPHAQLALGIFNRDTPYDALIALAEKYGFAMPLMPWEIYDQFGEALGWRFWLGSRAVLRDQLARIAHVAQRLADDVSRETLLRLCAFRLGLDLGYASYRASENQYFNALTLAPLRGRSMAYLDCGAYDGDTYLDLVQQTDMHCHQAFLLEPDPANYARLVNQVGDHPQVVCLPLAAAETYKILSFKSGQGEGSVIGADGDVHIAAVALDELLPQARIDFIKLDVEGAEAQVLRGARRLIERCRPVLALSLYHNPQDLWELPEQLFDMCPNYRFHIRQHYNNSFDSVLYAVPEQSADTGIKRP